MLGETVESKRLFTLEILAYKDLVKRSWHQLKFNIEMLTLPHILIFMSNIHVYNCHYRNAKRKEHCRKVKDHNKLGMFLNRTCAVPSHNM